ncbi:MAG: ABC transporter substrate-binding protein [Lachnospiraceae bacterium]
MKTLKRTGAGLLTAALAAGLLAGCGSSSTDTTTAASSGSSSASTTTAAATTGSSSSSSSSSSEMTFAWWGNQVRNEETQNAIDEYESETGISIDGQFSQWSDYWQKLATASAGNELPDVIQMDYSYLNQYVSSGLLADLTSYTTDGTMDTTNWNESMINAGTVDGKLYAVCSGINAPCLIYDKSITDAAGVTIKDNMTLDEFVEICKTIYEKTGYKTNIEYGEASGVFSYWLRADGKVFFTDEGVNATEEELAAYYDIYVDGMTNGWMVSPEIFAELSIGTTEQDPLVYGSSPDARSWCAFKTSNMYVGYLNVAQDGQELLLTTQPSKDPQKSNYLKPSMFYAVSRDAEDPQAAAAFIAWLTNSEEANNLLMGERGIPLNSEIADMVKELLSEDEQAIYTYVEDVVVDNSSDINPPDPTGNSEAVSVFNQILEQLCYGMISSEDAASQMISEGTSVLQSKASS